MRCSLIILHARGKMTLPIRYWLTRVGEHLSANQIHALKAAAKYLEIGCRMGQFGHRLRPRFKTRVELFDLVGREVGDRRVLYLEFGVFEGASIRYWSKILHHPESKLHGFDSFEGLPEAWGDTMTKGHFSTAGAIPVIDDPRVKFFKGWFSQTLPEYRVPAHEVLVMNLDADLYSSTKCVLEHFSSYIVPGTYMYFDEYCDLEHEFRAFMEFSASTSRKFVVRGATEGFFSVLFQCVA